MLACVYLFVIVWSSNDDGFRCKILSVLILRFLWGQVRPMSSAVDSKEPRRVRGVVFDLGGTLKYKADKEKQKHVKVNLLADFVLKTFKFTDSKQWREKAVELKEIPDAATKPDEELRKAVFVARWLATMKAWKQEKRCTKLLHMERTADTVLKQCRPPWLCRSLLPHSRLHL